MLEWTKIKQFAKLEKIKRYSNLIKPIFITGGVAAAVIGILPFILANAPPAAILEIEPPEKYGYAPLDIVANGSKSTDKDGDPLTYSWKLNGKAIPETSSLLEQKLTTGGKYRLEFQVSDGKHNISPLLELITVLPPLKDISLEPLSEDTTIKEPNVTLVLPKTIVTNGFALTIEAGGIKASKTQIISSATIKAPSGASGPNGANAGNAWGSEKPGGNGGNGVNGKPGTDGVSPKPIILKAGFISGELDIRNIGQNGGDGGNGGNGGKGGNGGDGRNRGGNAFCTNAKQPGNGGRAGRGGNAGNGGDAGNGGNGGDVIIEADAMDALITIDTSPGIAGINGQKGTAGNPGSPGRGGKGNHCGGGGDGGAGNTKGSGGKDGAPGTNGNIGTIKIITNGDEQIHEVAKATVQRKDI